MTQNPSTYYHKTHILTHCRDITKNKKKADVLGYNPPQPSADAKARAELQLYSASGPSWPVIGRTSPLTFNLATTRVKDADNRPPLILKNYSYKGQEKIPKTF